jgi:putative FmdB family regulatory protein
MPLYEYKCTTCGSVFEILQKANDPPLKKCIHCQAAVKKVLSPPALQFKGSGWYVTDYASKASQAPDSEPKEKPKKDKDETPKKKSSPSSSSENNNS